MEGWSDLFLAAAGAGAALAGLLFVAVSINLDRILAVKGVPERALQTLAMLLGVVLVGLFGTAPQADTAFAVELLAIGLALVAGFLATLPITHKAAGGRWWGFQVLLLVVGSVPYAIAALIEFFGAGGWLYWALAGLVGAITGAVANAWVLLVEILR